MWLHLTKQSSLKNIPFRHTRAGTTPKIAVAYLGRPHLVRGQVLECMASIFELAKFDDRAETFIIASALVISGTSLSSAPTFQQSCIVSSTSNLSQVLVVVSPVGGGVQNSTLQRH